MTGAVRWPLSFPQHGRLVRDAERGPVAYNMSAAFDVDGRLDPGRLAASLARAMRRHALLRGRIDAGVDPPQWIIEPLADVPLTVRTAEVARIDQAGEAAAGRAFDRSAAPLWHCALWRDPGGRQTLQFTFDHMVMDAASLEILLAELDAPDGLPPPRGYGEFAWRQADRFGSCDAPALRFWRSALAGTAPNRPVLLPFLRDPRGPLSGVIERTTLRFGNGDRERLAARAAGGRVTMFVLLTAGIAAVLARLSGEPDITLRVPASGRPPGFQGTVGWFANLVHVRLPEAGLGGLADVVRHTRATWAAQLRYQDTPYDAVLACVEPRLRIRDHRPAVVTVNAVRPVRPTDALGVRLHPRTGGGATGDEAGLHFLAEHDAHRLDLHCSFDPHRYARADVDQVLATVRRFLLGAD